MDELASEPDEQRPARPLQWDGKGGWVSKAPAPVGREAKSVSGESAVAAAKTARNRKVGLIVLVVVILVIIGASRGNGGTDDPGSAETDSRSSSRLATHRAYCEGLLSEEPRRLIGFESRSAFLDDCVDAQSQYDDTFGEDAR